MEKEHKEIYVKVQKEFLEAVLNNFREARIHGVFTLEDILKQIDEGKSTIEIVYGDNFEITFSNFEDKTIHVSTTYSNQRITKEFVEQLNLIQLSSGALQTYIRSLIQWSKFEVEE